MPNLTTKILSDIRDEVRGINHKLEETNQRLDETKQSLGAGIEALRQEVGARFVEADTRILTAVGGLHGTLLDFVDRDRSIAKRIDHLDARVRKLEGRKR